MDKMICPECKGSKGEYCTTETERIANGAPVVINYFLPCFYCAGTGYQTDEDAFERFNGAY